MIEKNLSHFIEKLLSALRRMTAYTSHAEYLRFLSELVRELWMITNTVSKYTMAAFKSTRYYNFLVLVQDTLLVIDVR